MVADAHGDISSTARPCSAMFSVAATSQRHDQVTLLIHRLHRMQASVIRMSVATDITICLGRCCGSADVRVVHSGGASGRGDNSDSRLGRWTLGRTRVVVSAGATVTGEDSM